MSARRLVHGMLLALACLLSLGAAAFAGAATHTLTGRVVAVADGDTLTVLDGRQQVRIRVQGIDAPERKQAFGTRSREALSACAFGKSVTVQWEELDRFGRTVGRVFAGGTDCGLEQIKAGLAWHFVQFARRQPPAERAAYAQAEIEARAARRGLWQDSDPVPPWNFRHKAKP